MDKIEGCSLFLFCCLPVRKVACSTKGESGFKDRGLLVRLSDCQTDMRPGNVSPFTASHVEQGNFGGFASLRLK